MHDRLRSELDYKIPLSQVCELCHSVGVLAEGVSEMGRTLVGVVEVRPKQLLEDGVRRELVHRVAAIMHHNLAFAAKKVSITSAWNSSNR